MLGSENSGWIAAVAGLLELGLLLGAVYLTAYQFRRTRSSAYIERFNSRDMLESRVAVDRWLREHQTTSARLEALENDPHLLTQVRQFANLFQELGAAYQFRVVHRKTVGILFDALVVMYWEQLRFWIYDYRARLSPTLYARFEHLYREMHRQLRSSERNVEYVVGYGSLMDPASVSAALGRAVSPDELIPVTLNGFKRSLVDRGTGSARPRDSGTSQAVLVRAARRTWRVTGQAENPVRIDSVELPLLERVTTSTHRRSSVWQ
jgi:hypothetical protein